jgi:hypothetical protein
MKNNTKESIFWIFWLVLTAIALIFLFLSSPKKASGDVFREKLPEGPDYYKDIGQFKLLKMDQSPVIPWIYTATLGKIDSRNNSEMPTGKIMLTEKLILVLDVKREDKYRIVAIWHRIREKQEIVTISCHVDMDYLETLGNNEEPHWKNFDDFHCPEEIGNFLYNLNKIYEKELEKGGKK